MLLALVLASSLSGCAVSMPFPGFVDDAPTGAIDPRVAPASATPKSEAQLPPKPSLELASARLDP
ncbi:MAG: hypothetical protein ACLPN5_17470 [Roseiarcus sp.]